MKKLFFLITVIVALAASSNAQYRVPSYLNTNSFDYNTIVKYIQDSVNNLDPIEGIYSVRLVRKNVYSTGAVYDEKHVYRCAIVKIEDNKYKMLDETILKSEYGGESRHSLRTIISSNSNTTTSYNVDLLYSNYEEKKGPVSTYSRIDLESLMQFSMSVVVNYYSTYTGNLKIFDEYVFVKDYPTASMYIEGLKPNEGNRWTGSGYAIGNGYIVTNNHVADGAKNISVKGVKGDMNTGYSAEVVTTDKTNDIAILKIKDSRFNGFGAIPYSVTSRMADVGEDVFVLGYPLTQALGNEIKLTNGIISSRTGYQGDVATYQMSAPVQPGNSGGPMFDKNGNVVGIVVAGVPGAENVGYAIKISYLKNLIESASLNIKFPTNNTVSSLSLAEKVKRVKNFVFYIECNN